MPPGLAGYVMVIEDKGEGLIGKQDFCGGSESNGQEEEQEPLERSFVSRGIELVRGRAGAVFRMLSQAPSPGPVYRSYWQLQPLHRVGPGKRPWPGC